MNISENINWERRKDLEIDITECMWIEVKPEKAKSLLIGSIYRPPDDSLYLPRNWFELFNNMLVNVNNLEMETILMGDININYLKKTAHSNIKDMIVGQGFKQLIESPTRITPESKTLIDVILSNKSSHIYKSNVIPLSISDYDSIDCVRKINHHKTQP